MLRVNYLPPEQMPTHQRDFPRNDQVVEMPRTDGSHQLALLVIMYLLALLGGIVLLGQFTATPSPSMSASSARAA
jgi:hypothetical protein